LIVSPPVSGTAAVNPDHTVSYTSTGNTGTDTFTYNVCDQNGPCATAAVTVTVGPNNQGPKTVPTFAPAVLWQPVRIDVLGNVFPTSAPIDPASLVIDTPPSHGTVVLNPDHTITYTRAFPTLGPDSFTYMISDTAGQSVKGIAPSE